MRCLTILWGKTSEQEKGVTKGFRRDFGGLGDGEMEPLLCLHIKSPRWNLKLYY